MMYYNKPHCDLFDVHYADAEHHEYSHLDLIPKAHHCGGCAKGHCTCGGFNDGHCHCGGHSYGICAAVVDDANGKVYLYGNVLHENYHVPGSDYLAFTSVESTGFEADGRMGKSQYFTGIQPDNSVVLTYCPIVDNTMFVYVDGLKKVKDVDYVVHDKVVHFNEQLTETSKIEVIYEYGA